MQIITNTEELDNIIATIEMESAFVAIDTEFLREKTYYAKLCLIQIATTQVKAIIDPLATGLKLDSFFALLKNQKITKVFFAGRQDIEILYFASGGILPSPTFDCQLAAMLCGHETSISYQQLVLSLLKVKLDKSSRLTDWSVRPLSQKQQEYALDDVIYLCAIYLKLSKRLKKNGRESWLLEELEPLLCKETYDPPIENAWQKLKIKASTSLELATIQHLAAWREIEAKRCDLPRGWVLKDEVIQEVSTSRPQNIDELAELKSAKKFGLKQTDKLTQICAIVSNVESLPAAALPSVQPSKNENHIGSKELVELLQLLLKLVAEKHHLPPSLIATTQNLKQVVLQTGCQDTVLGRGWRAEIFGELAEDLLRNKLGFCVKNKQIVYYKL